MRDNPRHLEKRSVLLVGDLGRFGGAVEGKEKMVIEDGRLWPAALKLVDQPGAIFGGGSSIEGTACRNRIRHHLHNEQQVDQGRCGVGRWCHDW